MAHSEEHFRQAYQQGAPPWDIGKPDFNLVNTVTSMPIAACRALDIGCGTGDNAIWLSQQGFEVVGVDSSEIAIERAKEKAADYRVRNTFLVLNILNDPLDEAPFGFVFDRGCFHTMDSDEQRRGFARQVRNHLEENGLWLSLIGNADEQQLSEGPPKLTAREIVSVVEPYFEILSLVSSYFEANLPTPPKAWVCLMRKRAAG